MTTLVIADDHALVREGIHALLERAPDIQVLGEAADGIEAVRLVQELKPDVLLIDVSMPRRNGIEAIQELRDLNSRTRVLVVSIHAEEAIVLRALRAGAKGYLLKEAFKEELFLAVRAAARGEIFLSPRLMNLMLNDLILGDSKSVSVNPLDRLSARERQVLQLIMEGQTNRQMAGQMNISIKTVDKHRTNLMKKLNVHNVTSLMQLAIDNNTLYVRA